jgi:hypothetical protein
MVQACNQRYAQSHQAVKKRRWDRAKKLPHVAILPPKGHLDGFEREGSLSLTFAMRRRLP